MGLLRYLLAASVLIGHAGGIPGLTAANGSSLVLANGDTAVQAFYVISGFYMSMVWIEKYRLADKPKRSFWLSRYLRLAPLYLLISVLSLLALYVLEGDLGNYGHADLADILVAALSNLTLVGQDLYMFFGYDTQTASFIFMPDILRGGLAAAGPDVAPGWKFLAIEQGWSIGIEIWFYLLAPFILHRSTRLLVALFLLSFAIRIVLYKGLGWKEDPWTYRFFPSELALFLLGALSHRIYRAGRLIAPARPAMLILAGMVALCLFYPLLPGGGSERRWLFVVLLAFSLPSIFSLTRHSRLDAAIGELSYAIYLNHLLLLLLLKSAGLGSGLWCLAASTLFAIVTHVLVDRPVDRLRAGLLRFRPGRSPATAD